MDRQTDLAQIEKLLAQDMLLREERVRLYRLAEQYKVDIRARRLAKLRAQGILFDDDVVELKRLDPKVELRRIDLTEH